MTLTTRPGGALLSFPTVQKQGVSLKTQPQNTHALSHKNYTESKSTARLVDSLTSPVTLESKLLWLLGRCSLQLRGSCAEASMVY